MSIAENMLRGWCIYLENNLKEREEEIKILKVLEDKPRDMSEPLDDRNVNKITLSTDHGRIVQYVTDEQQNAILSGKITKFVIGIKEQIVSAKLS